MADYYPIFLDLEKFSCLVVGGGEVAARKIASLSQVGADITVISPEFAQQTRQFCADENINCKTKNYEKEDIKGHHFVIVATSDSQLNRKIAHQALDSNILVNVVDNKALSNFIVPASVSRGPLQLAISTDGASPALSAEIRKNLEEEFGEVFGRYLDIVQELRKLLKQKLPPEERRKILLEAGGEEIYNFLQQGDLSAALSHLKDLLPENINSQLETIM